MKKQDRALCAQKTDRLASLLNGDYKSLRGDSRAKGSSEGELRSRRSMVKKAHRPRKPLRKAPKKRAAHHGQKAPFCGLLQVFVLDLLGSVAASWEMASRWTAELQL